jgi:hypothetical protein
MVAIDPGMPCRFSRNDSLFGAKGVTLDADELESRPLARLKRSHEAAAAAKRISVKTSFVPKEVCSAVEVEVGRSFFISCRKYILSYNNLSIGPVVLKILLLWDKIHAMAGERTFPYSEAIDLLVGKRKMDRWLRDEEVKEGGIFCMTVSRCPQYNMVYPMCSRCPFWEGTLDVLKRDLEKRLESEPNVVNAVHKITSFKRWDDGQDGVAHALVETTIGWKLLATQGLGAAIADTPNKKEYWGQYLFSVYPNDYREIDLSLGYQIKSEGEIVGGLRNHYGAMRSREIMQNLGMNATTDEIRRKARENGLRREINKTQENITNHLLRKGEKHRSRLNELLKR